MFTKRLIAGLLAVLLCFALVACNTTPPQSSASDTSDIDSTQGTTAGTTEPSSSQTTQTTQKPLPPLNTTIAVSEDDLESVPVGKHVTLRYNANAADVTYETKKGVGSKEDVTITVTPKNGYTFDGFTQGDAIANGKTPVTTQTSYSFTATAATTIFVNSSFTLTYHANGGEFKNGFDGTDTFSAVFYLNPNTLHDNGSFARDGYTLIGYNTKADGTGEYVTLGGRVNADGKGALDLWCVWAENSPEGDFTVEDNGTGVAITKYNGTAEIVTIPETIGGKAVNKIATDAFLNNTTMKMLVVTKNVGTIQKNAFNNCSALESIVIWDTSYTQSSFSDSCMKDCGAFQSVYINTVYTLTNDWFACGASKFDRLMWAKDKKKIIIVGGSGSLYGYDSAVIDAALYGEYEIVNLGENANITALMHFDIIEEFITEGDIVLWCPEPGTWTLGSDDCNRRFWDFRKADYGFMQYLNLSYYKNFFSSFGYNCSLLAGSKFKDFDTLSSSVSKYGDVLSNRDSKLNHYDYNFDYYLTEDDTLTELFGNITAKGGKIFFSFAAMEDPRSYKEAIQSNQTLTEQAKANKIKELEESYASMLRDLVFYEEMITELPGVISISDSENCFYDYRQVWDSAWHLTDEGATLRSQHVAYDLLRALGKID